MERNNRKVYTGTVVSTKMDKTITVQVEIPWNIPTNRMLLRRLPG